MSGRLVLVLLAVAACAFALTPASAAAAAGTPSELFVLTAGSGRLVQGHDGFALVLSAPSRSVTGFSDRPQRLLGRRALGSFVSGWSRLGFAGDPPNAALVVDDAPTSDDINVFELSRPALGRGGRTLTFSARPLTRPPTGLLSRYARGADRPRTRRFGRSSLFVDGSGQDAMLVFSFTATSEESQGGAVTFSNATIFDSDVVAAPGSPLAEVGVTAQSFQLSSGGGAPFSATMTVQVELDGGASNVQGTAIVPGGGTGTVAVNGGSAQTLAGGDFSLPLSGS
ncbi:MAG TPA: hypothetical protein VH231_12560 [Solirubrobacteraceae bacterium]|nr:hypothetical protein [Solirubrobacteraceae bacterium]